MSSSDGWERHLEEGVIIGEGVELHPLSALPCFLHNDDLHNDDLLLGLLLLFPRCVQLPGVRILAALFPSPELGVSPAHCSPHSPHPLQHKPEQARELGTISALELGTT